RLEGEAEAAAIAARGGAEAEAMRKRAEAYGQYGDAAILQMVVEVLPQIVAKASEPLSAVDKMTVISTDGAGRIPRAVADNVAQGIELLGSTTGVDLTRLLKGVAERTTTAAAGQSPHSGRLNGKVEIAD
ncbi:MAG: flotillin family protein, partial [Streptomycetaceae bacterium]|nr:flotillin family protein [Streptomycetaceae bacterium]